MSNPIRFLNPEHRPVVKRFISFPPADLQGLSDRLGVAVGYAEQPEPLDVHFMDGFNIIYLKSGMSESKTRYFLAKGLAKFMLRDREYLSNQMLANIATEMIMPEVVVRDYCELNNCDPKYHPQIAKHFKVSLSALKFRLGSLGYRVGEDDSELA